MKQAGASPELFRRALDIFDRVRAEPPEVRERLLDEDDSMSDALRACVRDLLAHDSPTEQFLGMSVGRVAAEMAAPLADALTPKTIGRYRVEREIGRGGFGRVYLAEQERPRRLVAVKVLRAGSSEVDARRLLFEAEALARLDHPAIARVYECGAVAADDPRPFIAMEYIDGVSLDRHAEGLSRRDRLALLEQVCEGLGHAHRRGVLHRDFAAKNILVDGSGRPRIIDFGLASTAARDHASLTMTVDGTLLGTLRSMSPEQLSGNPNAIDTRSDLFSLGVIVFEIITGRHPFLSDSMEIGPAIRAMLEAPALRPSHVDRSLLGDAEAVLLKCVERHPHRRYQSAAALAADLSALRFGQPVAARAYSTGERLIAWSLRHKRTVLACAILTAAVVAAGTATVQALRREAQANDAAVNALDAVVTNVIAPLAPRVGTLEERERLLASITPDVNRLMARATVDPRVARITGAFLAALGDAHVDRLDYASSLPEYAHAVEAYERAISLGDETIDTAHAASIVLVKRGDAIARTGGDATTDYVRALAIDQRLAQSDPTDLRVLSNLFWSHWRLARSLLDRRGAEHVEPAARVATSMMSIDPAAWRSLEATATILTRRGIEQCIAGDEAVGLTSLAQAYDAGRALIAHDPRSQVFLKIMVRSGVALASCAVAGGREELAVAPLRTAAEAIPQLGVPASDLENRRLYVEAIHEPLAAIALARGDAEAALGHTEVIIASFREGRPIDHAGCELAIMKLRTWRTHIAALRALGRGEEAARAEDDMRSDARLLAAAPYSSDVARAWFRAMVDGPATESRVPHGTAARGVSSPGDLPRGFTADSQLVYRRE